MSFGIVSCHADLKTIIGLTRQSIKSKTKSFLSFVGCFITSSNADIDLISINRNYLQDQIKNFPSDSFIIYDSDAYNKKRPEADEYLKNEYLMGIKELFCYHANAGKGKTFNKLLNTDCTF